MYKTFHFQSIFIFCSLQEKKSVKGKSTKNKNTNIKNLITKFVVKSIYFVR